MPSHKFYMLHYIANQNFVGDHIHRVNTPQEMLDALIEKYNRTLQKAQIYAVFCFDEETQSWKGFDFDGAVEYLRGILGK